MENAGREHVVIKQIWIGSMLLLAMVGAHAYPTLFGPTGAAALPTADIGGNSPFSMASSAYMLDDETLVPTRAVFAPTRSVEFGGLFDFNNTFQTIGGHAKYGFPLFGKPGFAIGGLVTDSSKQNQTTSQAYVVHTHAFGSQEKMSGVRLSVGANWTRLKVTEVCPEISESGLRAFAIADVATCGNAILAAEYQTRLRRLGESKALTSAVLRVPVGNLIGVEVGWTNTSPLGPISTREHNFFAGLSLKYGNRCAPPPQVSLEECPPTTQVSLQCPPLVIIPCH